MSFRINTNIAAMGALRSASVNSTELSKSINRLSTGLRINSGADDPAGLIASEGFRAQISGMDAAVRNNQDAMNFAKTADSAMDEISRLLRDARALAVANGNSTVDAAQKQANQTQLNNILQSVDRISQNTQFGSKKLLDGSAGTYATINTAANFASASVSGSIGGTAMSANGTLGVNVTTAATRATVTGSAAYATGATTVGAGSFTLNGQTFTTSATTTRDELVAMLNQASADTGVTASVNGTNNIVLTQAEFGSDRAINLTNSAGLVNTAAGSSTAAGVDAVATVTYTAGSVTASATFNAGRGLELRDNSGNVIKLSAAGNAVANNTNAIQVTSNQASFQIGANAGQRAFLNLGNMSSASLGLGSVSITGNDMSAALNSIDSAISSVANSRAGVGSFMRNTLESNVRSLNVARESLAATESSIRDLDVANEMTNYTKLQILQQSGLAMLAQANSAPQSILSLLR